MLYIMRCWCIASGTVLVLMIILVTMIELHLDQLEISMEDKVADLRNTTKEWKSKRHVVPRLKETAIVQVFYLEHLLASWVLQASPWNAYHSGIGFRVKDTEEDEEWRLYAIDYAPAFTSEVAYVLHPRIEPQYPEYLPRFLGLLYARFFVSYDIIWSNLGGTRYYKDWPTRYTNYTKIGTTNGQIFNKYLDWIHDWDDNHEAFEPVEIVINGSLLEGTGSCMCHDLFYYSLYALRELGFEPSPSSHVFRDHIIVFAKNYKQVDVNAPGIKWEVIKYYRLFMQFMELINKEFTNIRNLLVESDSIFVTPYLYIGGEYIEVELEPPFVNYCYLEVLMPPLKSTLDNEHLCALPMEIPHHQSDSGISGLIEKIKYISSSSRSLLFVAEILLDDSRVWAAVLSVFLMTIAF